MTSTASFIEPLRQALDTVRGAIDLLHAAGSPSSDYRMDLVERPISQRLYDYPVSEAPAYTTSDPYDWRSIADDQAAEVYNEDYYAQFVGIDVQGAGHADISGLMKQLLQTDPNDMSAVTPIVHELAAIRGVSPDAFMSQYDRYLRLIEDGSGYNGNHHYMPSEDKMDYMGSLSHLRYGTVVGDVLGVDPLFAALLNPTGGIVGPDQFGQVTDPEVPLTYHGIFHDAGGFLFNKFDAGPGYDYLTFDTQADSPLAGQVSGVLYWQEHLNQGGADLVGDVAEWGTHFLGDVVDHYVDEGGAWLHDRADQVGGYVDRALDSAGETFDFVPGAERFFDTAGDLANDSVSSLGDHLQDAINSQTDYWEDQLDAVGVAIDNTFDDVQVVVDTASAVGGYVVDGLEAAGRFFSSF